ncbi:FRG domain-containing protein [Undibacterium sp.]|uniref:FRG domain-containing protein n=1 Tax=Undibacterium sp. TaxID=1914977 RepID=UPI0025F92F3A|nr:FRG domain-containing protein [Undibacterium sp.]
MFNFLVTSTAGRWNQGFYEWEKGRILEYTEKNISDKFEKLSEAALKTMSSYPCLFAYEGNTHAMKVGKITKFVRRKNTVLIEFEFDTNLPEIAFNDIFPFFPLFDIREWEMNRTHWALKEGVLPDILRERRLLSPDIQSPAFSAIPEELPSINTAQIPIQSLQEFINKVLSESPEADTDVFYRGHSSLTEYKLEPSLFRKDTDGNLLYLTNEHLLYRELLVSNSADFDGDASTLDRLVRMQHYSMPTRLLDITSNPLIALFFACTAKDKANQEGEVIRFTIKRENVKYFDSDTASCIANLARLSNNEEIQYLQNEEATIESNFEESIKKFNEQSVLRRLHHFVCEEKPYFANRIHPDDLRRVLCVKGKKTNDRISSQSGAFLLFGDNAKLSEAGDDTYQITRYAITEKARMLRDLDALNINDSTVFPYIENSAKYVAAKFRFSAKTR